ncbi:hypothetical protein NDU88_004233 [Pleurodeles waltl]|uniref:Uncharacterized protein n=1 Tax=Pleurodeles waltl TaxID=8319 RepID=A0AAV7RKF2_PLEWA|nr:hypothetical protein NDU88_004233 [Pleurodeles waltl]
MDRRRYGRRAAKQLTWEEGGKTMDSANCERQLSAAPGDTWGRRRPFGATRLVYGMPCRALRTGLQLVCSRGVADPADRAEWEPAAAAAWDTAAPPGTSRRGAAAGQQQPGSQEREKDTTRHERPGGAPVDSGDGPHGRGASSTHETQPEEGDTMYMSKVNPQGGRTGQTGALQRAFSVRPGSRPGDEVG